MTRGKGTDVSTSLSLSLSLSLSHALTLSPPFNGHFPGKPELAGFIGAKDAGTGAMRRAKLQSNHRRQQTNTRLFTGRKYHPNPTDLLPNQQCQSTEGRERMCETVTL